jgi:hypothetical protein
MPDGNGATPIDAKQSADSTSRRDPILDLITRLDRDAATIAARDPDLSRTVRQIAEAAARPGRTDDPAFRTRVAYALQDMEKLGGPIATVPPGLREEMSRLAVTAPGLQNERVQALMRATPTMDDARLVRDVRSLARDTVREGADQNSQGIGDRIDALENRVRLAPSSPGATSNPDPRAVQQDSRADRPGPTNSETAQATRSPGNLSDAEKLVPNFTRTEETPKARSGGDQPAPQATITGRGPGIAARALAALARHVMQENPSWERAPTSVADRSERHENLFQQRRDEATIQGADKSQRAALDALQAFSNGPGAGILTKIQDAAKTEPGGVQAVLSEMREGGRFAGLRSRFNADLALERGTAAAWEKMASSLQQYGADRSAVAAVGARQNNAGVLEARFEKLDAEIGKAASIIPSRHDGKSVMDDLGEKVREILDRAVNAVKAAFAPAAEKSARASAAPAPAP